ncbi:hypothetical protein CBL20_25425, partial [Shigella flexneri]|uniref:hypothetical protein n=1 Tax=Shigella flexneri TaxID=623 RepID=UPI000B670955
KMIVQPLAIIGSHFFFFDSIAAGNLARPIAVYGRKMIVQPLAIIGSHFFFFDSIAAGNLARPIAVYG